MPPTTKNLLNILICLAMLGLYSLIRYFGRSKDARKREKIEQQDERNQMLRRTASMYTLLSLALINFALMLYSNWMGKAEYSLMLAFAYVIGVILYLIFYSTFDRKY